MQSVFGYIYIFTTANMIHNLQITAGISLQSEQHLSQKTAITVFVVLVCSPTPTGM